MRSQAMLAALTLAMVTGSLVAQDVPKQETQSRFDAAKMIGNWTYVSGKRAGNAASADNLASNVDINDKEFKLSNLPDGSEFTMEYKVDPEKSPAQIEMTITDGPVPEGHALGIVKFEGDQLVLCYDPTGSQYPDKFASTEANGWHLFQLKPVKSDFDPAKLVGSWKYVSGKQAGEAIARERLQDEVTATKDRFNVPAGPDNKFVMKYKIDTSTSPVAIDMEIESGPVPSGKALGIVKLDGDIWTLCYDSTGSHRPKSFESTAANGFFLFELKRSRKATDEADKK